MEGLIDHLVTYNRINQSKLLTLKGHKEYYQAELELNDKLRVFAVNCSLLYGGYNSVQAQLKIKSKREYTEIGGDEELPLGEEFQEHLKRFIKSHEKKPEKRLELVKKLVTQLAISWEMYPKLTSESLRIEQEELDIRSLQLLRAIIHNEERKLPENWEEDPSAHKKHLHWIRSIQVEMNEMEAVKKALPHLARPCDRVAKEVLAFVSVMLFNANEPVQTSLLTYFWQTREESFFAAIRTRIHLSALAIKEKRSLAAQQRARAKEALSQTKSLQAGMLAGKNALKEIQAMDTALKRQKYSQGRQASLSTLQCKTAKKKKMEETKKESTKEKKHKKSISEENLLNSEKSLKNDDIKKSMSSDLEAQKIPNEAKNIPNGIVNSKSTDDMESEDEKSVKRQEVAKDEEDFEDFEQKDDGFIKLVLSLLARMCDGQHAGLQDYLREQPDNLKSFNIIAETAQFVNLVYSNITAQNIDLCIQLFETLNEFTVGNQQNRSMMLNSKVVDYVNFILRAAEFKNCDQQDVLTLKLTIGNLIMSMIEENTPESLLVAKETKDTLDKEALYRCMTACYDACRPERSKTKTSKIPTKTEPVVTQTQLVPVALPFPSSQKELPKKLDPEMKELLDETGFVYYLIIARLYDLDPKLCKKEQLTIPTPQLEAFYYYKKNTMSIEVIKDDCLQKINFRVKNKNVLREEVKEKMIWNVDRSSPSNKIRDMMKWSKDILKDIYYQRRILSNPFATFFTKQWVIWNQIVIMLSVAINILMLVTWNAQVSLEDVQIPKNATSVPKDLYDPLPKIDLEQYDVILLVLGIIHNIFCGIVLITYFLSNHPTLPKISVVGEKIRQICARSKNEDEEEEKTHQSKLEVHFFSFTTFYYLLFLGMSVLGTVFKGYFFAFHLLNIVNNNQLLKGVIQAVTQNGKSLLWVAVLGFVVFYLYGLVSFALLRSSFDPDNDLYCATLWQCTVTVIRYGLVGQIFDKLNNHPAENTFSKFGILVIFHLSFFIFITTIGLNIIFGIIVDTFSELRDLKWTAERDMRDTCFICSRGSYDFEHHGMGFDYHINYEHDIWAYLFFFIHLHDTKQCDYTSLELYIFRLLNQEKFDFFPLNRALSLSVMDEGSTDSKIDDLLRYVISMVDRQREEDAKTKREEERQKQLRWREENRSALLQLGRSQSEHGDDSQGHFGSSSKQQKRKLRHTKVHHSHDIQLLSDKSKDSADEFQDYDVMPSKEDSLDGSEVRSPQDKWHIGSTNYEGNYPGVTTLESRNSSIIAPTDFQEDYNGKSFMHLNLEKIASRRSDASSRQSDLDRMSSIEETRDPPGFQSPRDSSRSASIQRVTPSIEDNEEALLADPFQVRRPSSARLSEQHSHFSSTDV